MAAGREAWTETRSYLQQLLSTGSLTNVPGYVTLVDTYNLWKQLIITGIDVVRIWFMIEGVLVS